MTASVTPAGPTREEFSERLLKGSVKKSYAPVVDIDWDTPLDPDKFYLPPRTVSLYGTPIWDEMSRTQRIELSRQEGIIALDLIPWFDVFKDDYSQTFATPFDRHPNAIRTPRHTSAWRMRCITRSRPRGRNCCDHLAARLSNRAFTLTDDALLCTTGPRHYAWGLAATPLLANAGVNG